MRVRDEDWNYHHSDAGGFIFRSNRSSWQRRVRVGRLGRELAPLRQHDPVIRRAVEGPVAGHVVDPDPAPRITASARSCPSHSGAAAARTQFDRVFVFEEDSSQPLHEVATIAMQPA